MEKEKMITFSDLDQINKDIFILHDALQDIKMSRDTARENVEEQICQGNQDTIDLIRDIEVLRDKAHEMIGSLSKKITLT